ncbi:MULTISPECIES: hypothetical protein [Dietzia]|uniref:hypothetical protein n=1 Tax=Dietzia TaxID=37914 RepID=UPI000804F462|nr:MULTISPECIES: hypothetical protein [Dietzia]OAV79167.1 hypothetical protein AYO52_08965 [Dietzia sp. 111N12-1]ODQ84079.1 hypothetical protein BFG51_00920 [Dietzia alimentaria]
MTEFDRTPRPAALGLAGLAVGFGAIGVAVGFATLLGITATASGGNDITRYRPMAVTAVSSSALGILLIVGGVLLWRAHRWSRVVLGAAVALLAANSLARVVLDSLTFISVVGSIFSLLVLVTMGYLLASDSIREHVREGVPLGLR